jgi:hypothetical protein
MKWHSFKFDGYNVETFICDDMSHENNKNLEIEIDGNFIGMIRYSGFNIPLESEVEAYVEEYFSEMSLGISE